MKRATVHLAARCRWALLLLPCLLGMGLAAPVPAPQEARQDSLAIQSPGARLLSARAAPGAPPVAAPPSSGEVVVSAPAVAVVAATLPRHSLPPRPLLRRTGIPRAPPA